MNTILYLDNIKCGGCANSISKKLTSIEGITEVDVDIEGGAIKMNFSNESILETAKTALAKMGYPEKGTSDFIDNAKSYVSCMIGRMS